MIDSYDSPWMDEELHIMRDAVAKFLQKEFVPKMNKWETQGFVDRDAWLIAGKAGLLCASIPEEYGGGGGNFKHEMVLVEELSYANVTGFGNGVHSGIVAHYINSYGSEEQKRKWLPLMASGEIVSAIAMTEYRYLGRRRIRFEWTEDIPYKWYDRESYLCCSED
jgi:acyl-CoA dehydrogenase